MANQTYRIDKYNFEIGFEWSTVGSADNYSKDVRNFLNQRKHNCFVEVRGSSEYDGNQLGTKPKSEIKGRSFSLAAYIFEIIEEDRYVFIRELGAEGYYVLEVENGYIQSSTSDKVYTEISEVQKIVARAAQSDAGIVIDSNNAETIAEGEGFDGFSIEEFISESKPDFKSLVRTTADGRNKIIKMAMVGLAVLGFALVTIQGYEFVKKRWEESQSDKRPIKTRRQIELEKIAEAERKVSERLMLRTKGLSPENQMQMCVDSYVAQNGLTEFGGWKIEKIVCSASGLQSNYVQQSLHDLTPEEFKTRFSGSNALKVSFVNHDEWLKKATVTNQLGAKGKPRRDGIIVSDLPNQSDINTKIRQKLQRLKTLGYNIVRISENPEVFSQEDQIPPEVNYIVGTITFQLSNLDQALVISSLLSEQFVTVGKLEVFDVSKPTIQGAVDKSLKHTLSINYFYK